MAEPERALHCPECGFVNAEGANYCQRCGAFLGQVDEPADSTTATYRIDESGDLVPVDLDDVVQQGRGHRKPWVGVLAARSGVGEKAECPARDTQQEADVVGRVARHATTDFLQ